MAGLVLMSESSRAEKTRVPDGIAVRLRLVVAGLAAQAEGQDVLAQGDDVARAQPLLLA